MGAGSSIGTNTNSLYAYGVIIAEYERYKRSLTDGTEELLGYDLDPLDDVTLMERMADLYRQALAQKDSTLEDSGLHPVIFAERYKALTEEGKVNYCKAVVEAQVALDKATFKSKPVEADYSKSFSGSAADTKAEKEAAALMKGEEDTKEVEVNPLLDPPKAAYSTFTANADLAKRYDRALLLSVGQWLKYFSNSGCYLYINTCTKEVASVRPSSYDEDEDKGGGILPEEELNNVGAGGGGAMGAAEAGEKVPEGVVVCSLRDLPGAVDRAVEDKKTPLILDPSEDGKVKTFFDYKYRLADASPLALPFAKSGLKRSDAVESYRKTLVGALKAGTTFALYLGELTQDDVNWKKKLCKKDCFPSETMVEAGRKLFSPPYEPRYRLIFREEDLEEGEIVLKNEENFRTVVISALKPKDYEAKLGESLALGYMQAIYVSG